MSFYLQNENLYAVPIFHHTMEMAMHVRRAIEELKPDCIAVELPEMYQPEFLHAASRLPDISVVVIDGSPPLYYLAEPCDGAFEALRSALEMKISAFCIDLAVEGYPLFYDQLPDPYATVHIGLKDYYEACSKSSFFPKHPLDQEREFFMAKKLKELSLQFECVLFVGGFSHMPAILKKVKCMNFPATTIPQKEYARVYSLTEESSREVLAECGWVSYHYELWRKKAPNGFLDRQKLIFSLFKTAARIYKENSGNPFLGYYFRNLMKFVRNYAHLYSRLMPDLFMILTAAKACVDSEFAYETWLLATTYPYLKNTDNLPELNLSIEEMWGKSKKIRFQIKQKSTKAFQLQKRKKELSSIRFSPPSPFSICSYPPEDITIEKFGDFLKKKGTTLLGDASSHTLAFTTSLEDGIDTKETIRHFHEQKLYVKKNSRPPGLVSSVVVIFEEDEALPEKEKYSWKTTWLGEHNQESDMGLYATSPQQKIVGPGISRCEYGGFMMTSPPRRLYDIWQDPDYANCNSKAEVLLMAAIDYAVQPLVVYVAKKPPRSKVKNYATRFGKKIIYIPIGGLSPTQLNKIRVFHVLDGHNKREIAGDYIF